MTDTLMRKRLLGAATVGAMIAGLLAPGVTPPVYAQSNSGVLGGSLCAPVGFAGGEPGGLVAGFLSVPQSASPEQKAALCCSELLSKGSEMQIEVGARLANEVRLLFEADEAAARLVTSSVAQCEAPPFVTAYSTALTNDRIGSLLGSLLGTGGEAGSNPGSGVGGTTGGGFFVPSPN